MPEAGLTLRIPFAVPKVTVEVVRFVFAMRGPCSHRSDWLWETIGEAKEKAYTRTYRIGTARPDD